MPDEISAEDRQQFYGVFKDSSFYSKTPKQQYETLYNMPVMAKVPKEYRGQIATALLGAQDKFRQKLDPRAGATGDWQQDTAYDKAKKMAPKVWDAVNTPLTQTIGETITGKSTTDKGTPFTIRGWREQAHKEDPLPTNPTAKKFRTALDASSEEAAGFLDSVQTPLGVMTMEGSALAKALPWKNAKQISRVGKLISTAAKWGFTGEQLNGLYTDLKETMDDPSTKNIAKLVTKSGILLGMLKPGERKQIKEVVDKGVLPEPKSVPAEAKTAKDYGVEQNTHHESKSLPNDELQKKVVEYQTKTDQLNRLRKFNESAGGSLEENRAKINKLYEQRDSAELALQDTTKLDKQISEMEQRYKGIHDKIAENHKTIESFKKENVEAHARLYQDEAARRRATPNKPKPGSPAKLLTAASPKPQQGATEGPAIPMGEAQPTKFRSAFDNTLAAAGAEGAPQIEAPKPQQGPIPQGGKVRPKVEFTPQLEGTTHQPALPSTPNRPQLPEAPTRTTEGAIIAGPVQETERPPVYGQQESVDLAKRYPDRPVVGKEPVKRTAKPPTAPKQEASSEDDKSVAPSTQVDKPSTQVEGPSSTVQEPKAGEHKNKNLLQEGAVTELPREEIHADPKRFQFKSKSVGKGGVTDKLKDVDFDPRQAGALTVWKDPKDGKTYVINGHHRLERANAAKYDKPLLVQYIDAANAPEARTKGALMNINEGNGEPLDAAKILRDGKFTPEDLKQFGISRNSPIVKQGLALSKLDDSVFEDVATGKVPEDKAVVIGEMLDKPADQKAAAKLAIQSEDKKITPSEFREALGFIKSGPKSTESKQDLFGDYEVEKNLYFEKGEVSDFIKNQLATEKRLFGTVGKEKNATRLAQAGNTINADESTERSQQAAQALDIYNKLKNMSGPVADILDSAAKELAEGGKPRDVKERAYQRIFQQLGTDLHSFFGGTKEAVRGGNEDAKQGGSVPLSAGVRPKSGQSILGLEKDIGKFNDERSKTAQQSEMQAKLNSKMGSGDKGNVVEKASPLFTGNPIDNSPPQASMFDEPPKSSTVHKTGKPPEAPKKTPTHEEVGAFMGYKNTDFDNINSALRKGKSLKPKEAEQVALMDSAIKKQTLPADTELWRGVSYGTPYAKAKPGDIITEDSYVSTSKSKWTAETHYRNEDGPLLKIMARKGQHAFDFTPHETAGQEVVLPRGTKLKIVSIDKSGDYPVIQAEVQDAK